ncbi:MAG TPA: aminomethyl-transferring glycine dehydrogenase subunit GcvPA [Candidatus Binataceae bacterium]|jgi:glycine dehydrogenase subunit 1|nr:aminomethyl-transferring glycine dehydrogenase subunit GcvPA [Candidatus Binataceae bacterium]
MRFLPQTETEIAQMLETVGAASIEDLIAHVPAELRQTAAIKLAPGLSEAQVAAKLEALAALDSGANKFRSFLGAGYYRHCIPAAVRTIMARSEFATSYTPYQPEASQGTLQAIFEFQTLITQLTGLEVANASMYDGASAAAEAVLMARRMLPSRDVVALSRGLWPDYRLAIRTYLSALAEIEVVEIPFDSGSGMIAIDQLRAVAGDRLLCIVAGYPNMFGIVEPLQAISEIAHGAGALSISATAEPLALGLLKAPGEVGTDIAVGEGQSFGLPLQYGGPGVGFFAARSAHVRQLPGRLVGETRDREGRRAFCLTLATREQHIRRERATSNICTNHSLCALAVTVYLSLMGAQGLRELAERNVEVAHYAADRLASAGIQRRFNGPFFNEFTVELGNVSKAIEAAERRGLLAGVPLQHDYPELGRALLICATEMNEPADIDLLCETLREGV